VATAASSRPKRHQGINKSLNENDVVPVSDVESSSSDYSRSPSPCLPSDSGTDTENSGEEGEVKINLEKEMSDQPVFGNNSDKQGKEIMAQPDNTMKNNAGVEEENIISGPTGQDKEKASQVEPTDEKRADPGDTNKSTKIAAQQDGYLQTESVPSEKEAEPSDTEIDTDEDEAPGEGDEDDEKTAIPSQPNINKIIIVTKITKDKIGDKVGEDKVGEPQKRDQNKKGSDEETWNREIEHIDVMVDSAEEDEEGADEDRTNPGRRNKNKNVTDENVGKSPTKPHKI
jgi:hypothetical protein